MFYAYDSAFGGRGTTDAIKQPKPPQPKQPKPPKPPKSLARKPSKADSLNSTSSDTTGSVRSTKSVLSAFNFGFSRKPSKNQLHLKLPGLHRTNTLESQHDDAQRRPQTASASTSNLRHARSASPLPITPSEPAMAQVVHEVALSNNCVKARDSSIHSSESRPVSPGPSIVPSFENMRINGSRRSKATSVDSVDRYAYNPMMGCDGAVVNRRSMAQFAVTALMEVIAHTDPFLHVNHGGRIATIAALSTCSH
jgi:hypothetical protein